MTEQQLSQAVFDRTVQLVQHRARCLKLAKSPWCHNKQMMLDMAAQAESEIAHEAQLAEWYAQRLEPQVQHWDVRRVGPDLCISFAGCRWSVQGLSGVAVDDLVAVQAASDPTAAPLMRAVNEEQPGTWASPPAPAHSCPRTAPVAGTPESSDSQTTGCGSSHECSRHAQHAHGTPPRPPAASPQGHTHSHSAGTAGAAPAADSIAKLVALAQRLAHEHGSPGTGKSLVSVSLHFSCGGDQ